MNYSLFKYKSEEAIKDGENLKRFEFSIDFGTWKKANVEASQQDLLAGWSFEYGTIN